MKYKTMNGRKAFNRASFEAMCEELEKGGTIAISINCRGNATAAFESGKYEAAMIGRFGDNLIIDEDTTTTTLYRLKVAKKAAEKWLKESFWKS